MSRPPLSVHAERRGSALVLAFVAVALLVSLAGAVLRVSGAYARETDSAGEGLRALQRAESGISEVSSTRPLAR